MKMRDYTPRHQTLNPRMGLRIHSYIQYFHTHFLSSVKVYTYLEGDWKRSNQSYGCLSHIPLNTILWTCEHSHTLYLLAIVNGQYVFLKAKQQIDNSSKSRLRMYCSEHLAPLICSIMNERVYSHYIHHTRVMV